MSQRRIPHGTAVRKAFASLGAIAAETLWPTRCAICDAPGEVLCARCTSKLRFIDLCKACPQCGAPYGIVQCSECNDVTLRSAGRESVPFDGFASPFVLDDAARRIVTTFKDGDEHRLCGIIADYMIRYVDPSWTHGCVITFIPCTLAAYRRRGFDHAEEIAQACAQKLKLPCAPLFERPRSVDQRDLGRQGRTSNMKDQFRLREGVRLDELPWERILVIDDICTTGATLFAAADTLRAAGTQRLYGLTFGKVIDVSR